MKKFVLLMIFTILAGITISCNKPVPPNSFRVKTRGKFHLFGIPLPFSVPNPGIAINLKTATAPNTPGTTGTINEFNPGGAFVNTDIGGRFDAVNAVLPAPYNAKVAPNQSRCTAPASAIISFSATNGSIHKINCKFNIQVNLLVEPGFVDLTGNSTTGNSLTGISGKAANDEALFLNAQNLKILYYRQVDGEDYELDGEKPALEVSPDGTQVQIALPDYYLNHGYVHYRLVVVEDGNADVYLSHGELDVEYPLAPTPTPTPTPCPPQLECLPDF
jgi:hypothetical protein